MKVNFKENESSVASKYLQQKEVNGADEFSDKPSGYHKQKVECSETQMMKLQGDIKELETQQNIIQVDLTVNKHKLLK